MKISIITLFPKMISGFFEESIVKRAMEKKLVKIELINLRDFAIDDYGSVDGRPYGGGVGMVLRADVVYKALDYAISGEPLHLAPGKSCHREIPLKKYKNNKIPRFARNDKRVVILTSPQGEVFTQKKAKRHSKLKHLIIISGHYEGVDERVLDFVDEEVSLGDFVLTGGEIVAAAITDSTVRLIPGVLKKNEATQHESFVPVAINRLIDTIGQDRLLQRLKNKGVKTIRLLEYPQYTRPESFMGKKVPSILLSGNHKEIEKWRFKKAFEQTVKKRPHLLS